MTIGYEVGMYYTAKDYQESGYNFLSGEYKLKAIQEGFPENPLKQGEEELVIAREQWLEGLEGTEQYEIDVEGNWYYFNFPENEEGIEAMWIPESIVIDAFQ